LAEVGVQAGNVEDLGDQGSHLEGVDGDDAVEGDGAGRQGVAGAAGHVGVLLEGGAGGGDFPELSDVGLGGGVWREGTE